MKGVGVADFLDAKRREIADRMRELRAAVDEYHVLEKAAAALEDVGVSLPTRRGPGRPKGSRNKSTTRAASAPRSSGARKSKNGRRRRSGGTRADQALKLVKANPGITIPELAGKMKIKQNYLYRVLPGLEKDGLIKREGRNWHPKES
jgi:ribosomal protein S25